MKMRKESEIDPDILFKYKDKELRKFEREILGKLKKMGVSFRQAEVFFDLMKYDLKDEFIKQ